MASIDSTRHELNLGKVRLRLPRSRPGRIGLGVGLMAGGVLGFLPILGFWMIPLGFIVLSRDIAPARRLRRRLAVYWQRRKRKKQASGQ